MPMPKNMELTTQEKQVLAFYMSTLAQTGAGPSQAEIARHFEFHINTARNVLKRLKEKGYMQEKPVTVMRLTPSAKARKAAL